MNGPPGVPTMSLPEKVAQMIFPRFSFGDPDYDEVRPLIKQGVGGLLLQKGSIFELGPVINSFQRLARVPLLTCADFEDGVGCVVDGATVLPSNMAVGATRSELHARRKGMITAREARSLGVSLIFAPVMDVNTEPSNPIINVRAFGGDPDLVSRMGRAFIEGCHDGGALACAKHFPGHGATERDSHIELPVIRKKRAELDATELKPFRETASLADSVMTAHVAVPDLDGDTPASVSVKITYEVLRKEMAYRGLIVTDALMMGGIAKHMNEEEALVRAVLAGSDVLLYPRDPRQAISSLVQAVERGEIPAAMIDRAVQRILAAKGRMGLFDDRMVAVERIETGVHRQEHQQWAQAMAEDSMTLVRDDGGLLSRWSGRSPVHLLHVPSLPEQSSGIFEQTLGEAGVSVDPRPPDRPDAWCVLAMHYHPRAYRDSAAMKEDGLTMVRNVLSVTKNVIAVSFGSPYLPAELSSLSCYICAYSGCEASQRAAARAILGQIPMKGQLPVTL